MVEEKSNVKKAVEVLNDGKPIGIIALWDDGHVTACMSSSKDGAGACYTSSKPEGEKLYYMAQAFYASIGPYEIKPIPTE